MECWICARDNFKKGSKIVLYDEVSVALLTISIEACLLRGQGLERYAAEEGEEEAGRRRLGS